MFKVLIKQKSDNKVIQEMLCEGFRSAERVERVVNINLNHGEYYTEIIDN